MKKTHYAWYTTVLCGLLMFGMSAQQMSQSVFYAKVADSLGVGMGVVSLCYSASTLCAFVMTPLTAYIFTKFPAKPLACIAIVDPFLSLLLLSVAKSPIVIAAACLMESFSISGFQHTFPSVMIKRWFNDRGSFAYNIMLFMSMIGGIIFTPVASAIINAEGWGWRWAYRAIALFVILELPITMLFLKESPETISVKPYEEAGAKRKNKVQNRPVMNANVTTKGAWKVPAFYLMALYTAFSVYPLAMQYHIPKHLATIGFTDTFAATVITAALVGGLVGRLVLSYLSDRYGIKVTNVVFCIIGVATLVLLCNSAHFSTVLILALGFFYGFAVRSGNVHGAVMKYELFGASPDYVSIMANSIIISNIISSTSSTVYGFMYDATGNYVGSFWLASITWILSVVLAFILLSGKKKAVEKANLETYQAAA